MDFGTLNAQFFGLAVDTLAGGVLRVNSMVEWPIAIQRDALDAAELPIHIFDTAFAFDELFVLTRLVSFLWKEEMTLETLILERPTLQ